MEADGFGPSTLAFLEAVATAAARMLARLQQQLLALPRGAHNAPDAGQLLGAAEAEFSCQALVNIVWALATLVGPAAMGHAPSRALFSVVNAEAVGRLRATASLLRARQPLPYHGVGGFNEQALSNVVFAFDKAGCLQHDLLAAVLDVAVLRLQGAGGGPHHERGGSHDGGGLSFKPQELVTLLKACHTLVAPPWAFLGALLSLLAAHPGAVDHWAGPEKAELQRAYLLYRGHQAEQAAAAHQAAAGALAPGGGLGGPGADAAAFAAAAMAGGFDAGQAQHMAAVLAALAAQQQDAQAQAQHAAVAQQAVAHQQAQQAAAATAWLEHTQRQHAPFSGGAPGPRAGAAARPPPAAMPRAFTASMFDAPGPAAAAAASSAGSSAASPRTPLGGAGVGGAAPLPGADTSFNKQSRVRLAHAPPQTQALLFAQTQQRLAGEGLATSTAGTLFGGGGGGGGGSNAPAPAAPRSPAPEQVMPAAPGCGAAAPPPAAAPPLAEAPPSHGAVDAAALRPWLLEAAAAAAAAGGAAASAAGLPPLAGSRA